MNSATVDKTKKPTDGNIRQKNKTLIFDAAKTEFVTYGFKGASIKRIAERAGLPRANIHYYFDNKTDLYQQLLNQILAVWNARFDTFDESDDAKTALSAYIRAKVMYSKTDPEGSRLFASEIIHGAPHLKPYLDDEFKQWVKRKTRVIEAWIMQGKIKPVNPLHLLFLIWSATQHYADFNVQVTSAMDKPQLDDQDFEEVVKSLTSIILGGCGIGS
ncbi:MAG: TetR family transcriptional regulator C-terminal domain-containing protein [Algicola sp.]|nr:TetR family transcriptional regulator C-terminal domain-containing protein [Algicola sp.]